ncbi:hypothetical protein N9P60_00525 [bacterium]|nr:hypothetical protein [bacterium]MDB9992608.1 hypothetical protein [bacterium]
MKKYKFEIWSQQGGKISTSTVEASSHANAKKLVESQNSGYVIKGGTVVG